MKKRLVICNRAEECNVSDACNRKVIHVERLACAYPLRGCGGQCVPVRAEVRNVTYYKSFFERINFGFNPPLKQTADVVFCTDIPFDDEHIEEFEKVKWKAMWEQNPQWRNPSSPIGNGAGWSSVLGGHKNDKIEVSKNF